VSRATLICAWAEKGADAIGPDGVVIHSDAFPPEKLVDTLGAGDTFNASVIYSLSNGMNASLVLKHKHLMGFCKLCNSVSSRFGYVFCRGQPTGCSHIWMPDCRQKMRCPWI